jgi:hypothetical protein
LADNRHVTHAPRQLSRAWRTLDFKPAPPGWRVVYLNSDKRQVVPMAGWIVQELYLLDIDADQAHDVESPERRVFPGVCLDAYGWEVEPVDSDASLLWMILGPGQTEPGEEEEAEERARRAEDARRRRG